MEASAETHAVRAKCRELFAEGSIAAQAWRAQTGRSIVGYLGTDVPVEIITAAGLLPFRIGAFDGNTEAVRKFLEMGDSDVVAQLASVFLDERLAFLDHVVVGNTPTFNITLFHFLREAKRLDPAFPGPPMIFHETHHGEGQTIEAFNLDSCSRLAQQLGDIGERITRQSLQAAIEHTDARRRQIQDVQSLRRSRPAQVSGTDALLHLARWQLMPQSPLPAISTVPRQRPRILLSGSDIGHFLHYPLIEATGCTIVADDHDWGEDALITCVEKTDEPLIAIANRYTHQAPHAMRWSRKVRIASVVQRAIDARADGVVFWISDEDQASSWDVPALSDALHARGVATLDLGPQPVADIDEAAIAAKMRRWLHSLQPMQQTVIA